VRDFGERGLESGKLMIPLGTAVDDLAGQVYVVDRSRFRLICFTPTGEYLWEVPVLNPLDVSVGASGDVFVFTFGPVVQFSPQGELIREVGTRGFAEGQFDFPRASVAVGDDTLIVADSNNARLQRVQIAGELTATAEWVLGEPPRVQDDPTTRFGVPSGVATDERGRIIVVDGFRHILEMIDPETRETLTDFGGEREGSAAGLFSLPTQITRMYGDTYAIADTFNDRIQIVRLIAPADRNVFTLYPWLKWLGLLPLLLLALLFGRKRVFVTEESFARAVTEGRARLLIGAFRKLHVLAPVAEAYADLVESEIRLGDYLVVVEPDMRADGDASGDAEQVLADAARPTTLQRVLLSRHRVVCVGQEQCERFEQHGRKTVSYDELIEEYVLAGDSERTSVSDGAQVAAAEDEDRTD
jgi:hypothetical protein